MRSIIIAFFLITLAYGAKAQHLINGRVTDKQSGAPLSGASVVLDNSFAGTFALSDGSFTFSNIESGNHIITIRFIGYKEYELEFVMNGDTTLSFELEKTFYHTEEVVITSTRAGNNDAGAYTNIDKKDLEKVNTGRDLPYLLETVPSLVATSDAGTGIGYTGVRIRGSDASRINVTINGIPINDSESQLLYWVNMPDLASSIDNIQVQRGVGTSTNGASAFGGSINIQSEITSDKPYLNTSSSYGSFNTFKSNASIGTGLLNDKWNFEGRLSKITSDGYIDRASSDLKSFYISGGYYGKKDKVKLNVFSGKEVTYQSWYGVPEASLDTNRTWNYYNYDNQVDNYQQDHYQLFYTHEFNTKLIFNSALHYTYGRGYYEEFETDQSLSEYGLTNVILNADTITNTDLIRRKWLDNDFYGVTWSLFYNPTTKLNFILGGAYNEYDGDHYGEIIWAQYASNSNINQRYYFDNGFKTDFNINLKTAIHIKEKLDLFADLQYRRVNYDFTGPGLNLLPEEQSVNYNFFNPKAGLTYHLNDNNYAYISFGTANKEPSRDDFTESTINSRPKSERLYDFESGYFIKSEKFMAGFNYFLMLYENQLVLTGQINDVGNYTRTNAAKSSREGIEIEAAWNPFQKLKLTGNLTFSKNIIDEYREYTDDYDNGGQQLAIYRKTDLAFSPSVIAFAGISSEIIKNFEITLSNKYIGKQYLDNTSSENKKLNPYFLNDFRVNYTLYPKFMKAIVLTCAVNNIMDVKYESNGYTFSYIIGGEKAHENYYYPQAGINYVIQATLKF